MEKILTLYELNSIVREVIEIELNREYWVEAELSELRESRGHCYMELIQTDANVSSPLVARASAKCWRNTWMLIRPHFERVTHQQMSAGMRVLLKVFPQFHEAYGFSWIVTDINPEFTLGDMAKKRMEIIRQLKEEGVFDLQKELVVPSFAQNIAVISSPTAAGYGDFCNQLAENEYGLVFHTELFEAVMQGEQVEQSVVEALDRINDRINDFDVVVIIRGGGATADLSGFDTLILAENVANFPIPVLTGIGHDRDESILDIISHTRVKTPTAAAAFLINHNLVTLRRIEDAKKRLIKVVSIRMEYEKTRLDGIARNVPLQFSLVKDRHFSKLDRIMQRLSSNIQISLREAAYNIEAVERKMVPLVERRMMQENHRLSLLEQRMKILNPERLLKQGYSLTLCNGKVVRRSEDLLKGDEIETRLGYGSIKSVVI